MTLCQRLTCEDWTTGEGISGELPSQFSTSLLHLAAALGLTRLTCSLLHWVAEKPGRRLCREVDPLSQDTEGFTPLVRETVEYSSGTTVWCVCCEATGWLELGYYFMSDVCYPSEYRGEQMNYYSAFVSNKKLLS